jgi:competence protein ComEC
MRTLLLFAAGILLDVMLWTQIVSADRTASSLYFLNVGQGDAQLLALPGDIQMLVDTGPGTAAAHELESVLGPADRYIDMIVITHTEKDHYGGLMGILEKYDVGAILWNGRRPTAGTEWIVVEEEIHKRKIPLLRVRRGDRFAIGDARVEILSPDLQLLASDNLNDGSIVQRMTVGNAKILLTADTGFTTEERLPVTSIAADILKVGHHGSKYSSAESFLRSVRPEISVIQVGERNTYGQPTEEALQRLKEVDSRVFRNDRNGRIELRLEADGVRVFTERM